MSAFSLLLIAFVHAASFTDAKIMDRLMAQSLEGLQVKGEDLCSGCDEEMCNQLASCGYVQVRNGGGYVAKICVNGQNNETHIPFCCTSGGFDLGQTAQIKLPCSANKLTLTAEEDIFINSWSVVATENYNNNTLHACYEMYGTTTHSKWKTVNCP